VHPVTRPSEAVHVQAEVVFRRSATGRGRFIEDEMADWLLRKAGTSAGACTSRRLCRDLNMTFGYVSDLVHRVQRMSP
jgi:hypothetical protein